jgi:hypothetical protein
MQKLWEFKDYVGHLKHANSSVRNWAFDAVEINPVRRSKESWVIPIKALYCKTGFRY